MLKQLEKTVQMSLTSLISASVKTTFLGQFLLVPKSNHHNHDRTTSHELDETAQTEYLNIQYRRDVFEEKSVHVGVLAGERRRSQHATAVARRRRTSSPIGPSSSSSRTPADSSNDGYCEHPAMFLSMTSDDDNYNDTGSRPNSTDDNTDADAPNSDWNMRDDCSVPDDFPSSSLHKQNHPSSDKDNNRRSKNKAQDSRRRMSQSEHSGSTRRSITSAATTESSRSLLQSRQQKASQAKQERGRRSSMPGTSTSASDNSMSLGDHNNNTLSTTKTPRSSHHHSSSSASASRKTTSGESSRRRESSSRRRTHSKPDDHSRSMSKSDPGRSSSSRRHSSARTHKSSSTPHHHHRHYHHHQKHYHLPGNPPKEHHRRRSVGNAEDGESSDDWKPVSFHSLGMADQNQKNKTNNSDNRKLSLADGLKNITRAVDEFPVTSIDDVDLTGNHSGIKRKTKIGRRLSQTTILKTNNTNSTTSTTAATDSVDGSMDLPDLKPIASTVSPKKDLSTSLGFSNADSPFLKSIAW